MSVGIGKNKIQSVSRNVDGAAEATGWETVEGTGSGFATGISTIGNTPKLCLGVLLGLRFERVLFMTIWYETARLVFLFYLTILTF